MEQLRTSNDMLRALQADIHAVRTGKMTEAVGRVVFRGRALQIRTAEVNLRYLSMAFRRGIEPKGEMTFLPDGKNAKGKAKV
jgi:hypothetical protein